MFIAILTVVLMVLEGICCLLLIGVILLQRTKGQGMGLAFGGGVGESLFGANMGNVLTKTTVTLAIVFLLNTAVLAYLGASRNERSIADNITGGAAVPTSPAGLPPTGPVSDVPVAAPAGDIPSAPDGGVSIPEPVSIPSPSVTPNPAAIPAAPTAPVDAVPEVVE